MTGILFGFERGEFGKKVAATQSISPGPTFEKLQNGLRIQHPVRRRTGVAPAFIFMRLQPSFCHPSFCLYLWPTAE
jgi:hypothetical protein